MRKRFAIGLPVACLAIIAAYGGWAFYQAAKVGVGWASVFQVWPYLLAGVLTVAAVIVLFVRLAFYSDQRGYDERAGEDDC